VNATVTVTSLQVVAGWEGFGAACAPAELTEADPGASDAATAYGDAGGINLTNITSCWSSLAFGAIFEPAVEAADTALRRPQLVTVDGEVTAVVARWHSHMVPAEVAAFAREVVAAAGPTSRGRAKALLFAASRAASFAVAAGLELRPEVVFCPPVIERFIVANELAPRPQTVPGPRDGGWHRRSCRRSLLSARPHLARARVPVPAGTVHHNRPCQM
jgi:hypothetical protein